MGNLLNCGAGGDCPNSSPLGGDTVDSSRPKALSSVDSQALQHHRHHHLPYGFIVHRRSNTNKANKKLNPKLTKTHVKPTLASQPKPVIEPQCSQKFVSYSASNNPITFNKSSVFPSSLASITQKMATEKHFKMTNSGISSLNSGSTKLIRNEVPIRNRKFPLPSVPGKAPTLKVPLKGASHLMVAKPQVQKPGSGRNVSKSIGKTGKFTR